MLGAGRSHSDLAAARKHTKRTSRYEKGKRSHSELANTPNAHQRYEKGKRSHSGWLRARMWHRLFAMNPGWGKFSLPQFFRIFHALSKNV